MPFFNLVQLLFSGRKINGSDRKELMFGSFVSDEIAGNGGNDLVFGFFGNDKLFGGAGEDVVFGGSGRDAVEGGDGEDRLFGGRGHDEVVGNKGDDQMFGGAGNDLLVWNNGDGSDLIDGGSGYDRQQVNFNTDLVNDDLQNDDVAEFSVTETGMQFARIQLNGQTERGLFQLDIRNTEVQETSFGAGDDTAVIVGNVLDKIELNLDGGDGVDELDFSQAADPVIVNLQDGTIETENGQGQHGTAVNFENVIGTAGDDVITSDEGDNVISGLGGVDSIFGGAGDDELVANKGNDFVFGGAGDDLMVWNNGDGSDLFDGGEGDDTVQVNFDTDLVNDDLQNKDVAEFSTTPDGVQFARIELNAQTERGLFQLDIRETETLETNFGDGDDTAVIVDDVLDQIALDLDGGVGIDTLNFGQADRGVTVDLAAGTAGSATVANFENVIGTNGNDVITGDSGDNVIRAGDGVNLLTGGEGADIFVFVEGEQSFTVILDFELGVDRIQFETSDPDVTPQSLLDSLVQDGDDVELGVNGNVVTLQDASVADFDSFDFLVA